MNFPKEIIKNHCLKPYKNDWNKGVIDLPNRLIYHLFKERNGFIYQVTIQNYDNEKVIDMYLKIVDTEINKQKLDLSKLNKVPLSNIEHFTNLIFAPFNYTLIPNSGFPEFDTKRIYIYPIFDFELTGKESIKDIKTITKKILSTTEWHRKPSPLIKYKFTNPKHQYGTVGKALVFDKKDNIYKALNKFETNDCLMEVENSIGKKCSITFNEDNKKYQIGKDSAYQFDFESIKEFLNDFFIQVN